MQIRPSPNHADSGSPGNMISEDIRFFTLSFQQVLLCLIYLLLALYRTEQSLSSP